MRVEEVVNGPGPLDLVVSARAFTGRPVYYDHPWQNSRARQSPLRFSRSVGVLVAVDHQTGARHVAKIDRKLR